MALLRLTLGVCPRCLAAVPAALVLEEGRAWLVKHCPDHGDARTLMAEDGAAWAELDGFCEEMMEPLGAPAGANLNLPLTDRCELACPICFARSGPGRGREREPRSEDVGPLLSGARGAKVQLYGGEPAARPDLPEVVAAVRASGNVPVLATNGLAIAGGDLLDRLVAAGLGEVHLQLDGFSSKASVTLRGRDLIAEKRSALARLEGAGVATGLECTLARGVNEDAVGEVLGYALAHPFVRGVFFRSYGRLGAAGLGPEARLRVEEVVALVSRASGGRVTPRGFAVVQKALFAAFGLLGVPSCHHEPFYPIVRQPGGGWSAAEELVDVEGLDAALERFRAARRRWRYAAAAALAADALPLVREPGPVRSLLAAAAGALSGAGPLDALRLPGALVVGAGALCDPDTMDLALAQRCDAGLVVRRGEPWLTQALDALREERRWRGLDKGGGDRGRA